MEEREQTADVLETRTSKDLRTGWVCLWGVKGGVGGSGDAKRE